MNDHYQDGSALYVLGVSGCAAAARTTTNPVFAVICDMCAAIIGTMLSDPEEIRDKARDVRAVTHDVDQAKSSVTTLLAETRYWEQMGRPQMADESARFTGEVAKTGDVYRELAGTLDQLAKMSATAALTSASLGGLLLVLAFAFRSAPVDPFANSVTTAAASQVQRKAMGVLLKMLTVYGSAAALALLAGALLRQFVDPGMTDAVTVTDAPAFEQVIIGELPVPEQA
ncbi:hypothetical protein FXF51_21960 [Nonomuraea sp. PA05]|uniref:hypothetical protein n=1 Tax=Nonomuraea sp. PA05 TaxID=2604466 RepID=UPI0011D7B3EE|nr:hypothetical protein [Nonomuraea sp. PA05]TYB64381.1 hypothetical protein FXF51_21960 [Nonomuraea sp. PA05]